MAALTSSLDTNMITTKVKEILLQHNVGQKVSRGTFCVRVYTLMFVAHCFNLSKYLSHIANFKVIFIQLGQTLIYKCHVKPG